MDKITFLNELELALDDLPREEKDSIMHKYENLFYEEELKGISESQIIKKLNDPYHISKEVKARSAIHYASYKLSKHSKSNTSIVKSWYFVVIYYFNTGCYHCITYSILFPYFYLFYLCTICFIILFSITWFRKCYKQCVFFNFFYRFRNYVYCYYFENW